MKRTQRGLKNGILICLVSILTILGPGKSARAQYDTWIRVDLPVESYHWELNGVHFTSSNEGWAVGEALREYERDARRYIRTFAILLHYLNGTWKSVDLPPETGSGTPLP